MGDQVKDPRYGKPFIGRSAAVASPNDIATIVGHNISLKGGNAIDTMVAVNAALSVVFPHMTGIGGDSFWLIYDAETQQQYVLNATGHSGQHVQAELFKDKNEIPNRGARAAITVPGAADGWYKAHKRFGKLPFKDCLAPAIYYAREGFPVSTSLARFSESKLNTLRSFEETAKTFLKDGVAPYRISQIMRNENIADLLSEIAEHGRDAFYKGEIPKRIAQSIQAHGGYLTAQDFENYEAEWTRPISVQYRDYIISSPPPNSEGIATLQVLGMLNKFSPEKLHRSHDAFIDIFTRATELAFIDRNHYVSDPDFYEVPTETLLQEDYLYNRAENIFYNYPETPETYINADGDTTFSCACDEVGNVVGVIQSVYWEWGSAFVPDDMGFVMQNRGTSFSLDPDVRNFLEPNKRPAHTLTCTMVSRNNRPEIILGSMGGDGQPQTQAMLVSRIVDQKYNVQNAIDRPRWLLGRTWGEKSNGLRVEDRFGSDIIEKLEKKGHRHVSFIHPYSDLVGHSQAIQIFKDHVEAAADPRALGLALGY